jgi:iron complex outermembrane receptor protein
MLQKFKWCAAAALLCPMFAHAQATLSGEVRSNAGEPLSNAHVQIENRAIGAFTDANGKFNLPLNEKGTYVLSASYLGFESYRDTIDVNEALVQCSIVLIPKAYISNEVLVQATRLRPKAPATFVTIEKQKLEKLNLGQDLPFLINWSPSVVATSDAGAGIGYTSLRIRGSDQTRINVTVNGIPINDSESHGVFWVNMPDLASSLSSVQIQRGLGTSTNGSGAFGASINMETNTVQEKPGAIISNTFGSFNTRRHMVQFNSGLLGNGLAIEGRLSNVQSDGYVDRASSDLNSYFLSAGYYGKKTMIKAVTMVGKERTFQSWYGVPESRLNNDVEGMLAHASREGYSEAQLDNLLNSGRTYNYYLYENEVDDYQQDHYQLHLTHQFRDDLSLTVSGHYTYGRGFFEQFREDDDFANYGLPNPIIGADTIGSTDLIRRRWLDNDFYGGTYALNYNINRHEILLGGGVHFYRGDHFGEVIWAETAEGLSPFERYYQGEGNKDEINNYIKWQYKTGKWNLLADAQVRYIYYEAFGTDNDLTPIDVSAEFLFFNPKVGARYDINPSNAMYAYIGRGSREPVRNDFIDAPEGVVPVHETLYNVELGYTLSKRGHVINVNGFYMGYENQLVPTGELNDVGAIVRRNVAQSYRAGIELDATFSLRKNVQWNLNTTLSRNKISSFDEVTYDYTEDFDIVVKRFTDTDISFSPSVMGMSRFLWSPVKNVELDLITRYVGQQYLDNTQNDSRAIDAYTTTDFRVSYRIENKVFKMIEFNVLVNNVFNAKYVSNGYTYSYIVGSQVTENFYYPQAGTNFLAGLNLHF